MAFAQLTYRESLRDIEACLRVQGSKLYPDFTNWTRYLRFWRRLIATSA
jgi:hypothetical protein